MRLCVIGAAVVAQRSSWLREARGWRFAAFVTKSDRHVNVWLSSARPNTSASAPQPLFAARLT
jgi:hypothetical protein